MSALRSMTGFGRAASPLGPATLVAEASSVNQRGLSLAFHLPSEWSSIEPELAAATRARLQRGKVTVKVGLEREGSLPELGEPLAQLRRLAHAHGIPGEPDWEVLLRLSERQAQAVPAPEDAVRSAVAAVCRSAIESLDASRAREGAALGADLLRRVAALGELVARMETSAAGGPARQRERLLRRLSELGVTLDPSDERVLRELALHAERADISEEITRLRSHLEQARELLGSPAPGRPLDFLAQELLREANTVGSKATEIETTRAVLEAKVEIERFREQVQNLE